MEELEPMKRVIRNADTLKYFKDGNWTQDVHKATNFPSIPDALRVCNRHHLKHAELVFCFGDPRLDVAVPIRT